MTEAALTPGRMRRLVEGAAAVAGQTDLSAVLLTTVETAMELTKAPSGALGVVGDAGELVEFIYSGVDQETAARIGHPPEGRGVLGIITGTGKTIRLDRIEDHPDSVGFPPHHPVMTSFLGVPVRVGGDIFGNLYLADKPEGFSEEDEIAVQALAVIAGTAVHTSRLQRRLRRYAVVEDRERIARELHDAVIQDLFAVGLSLQALGQMLPDDEMRKTIDDSVQRLDDTITSLRRFIFDLHPPDWLIRDLRREASDLLHNLANAYPASIRMSFAGDLNELPTSIIDDALHLIREAASNALRHSNSDWVDVMISSDADELTVMVSDEGVGFDTELRTPGMGLENMRVRTARAGGELTVISDPDTGTRIRVTLPV